MAGLTGSMPLINNSYTYLTFTAHIAAVARNVFALRNTLTSLFGAFG